MYETHTYDDPSVLPASARDHWTFMETNSAAAVMKAVCPAEWADVVSVLETYRLDPKIWLKAGGNRGDIAEQIDNAFSLRGWRETRLDLDLSLLSLARRLWSDYQETLPSDTRNSKLPIDLATSTVTAFDKAQLRVRRGVMGSRPVLIVAANETTWNGQSYG